MIRGSELSQLFFDNPLLRPHFASRSFDFDVSLFNFSFQKSSFSLNIFSVHLAKTKISNDEAMFNEMHKKSMSYKQRGNN